MGSKQALVDQIKAIQRSNPDAKQAWWTHCDTVLGGVRDPNRHDEGVLSSFIHKYKAGGVARPAGAVPGAFGAAGAGAYGAAGGYPMLMQQAAMQAAVAPKGLAAGGAGAGGGDVLAGFVKEGQRKSPKWREAWQKYCAIYGKNINDPARHSESVLVKFLDFVGGRAVGDLDAQGEQQGIDFERRGIKRAAASEWEPPAKRGATATGETAHLVVQVKELQRSSKDIKEAWWLYCDDKLGGVRDPARHDAATLRSFLASWGVGS